MAGCALVSSGHLSQNPSERSNARSNAALVDTQEPKLKKEHTKMILWKRRALSDSDCEFIINKTLTCAGEVNAIDPRLSTKRHDLEARLFVSAWVTTTASRIFLKNEIMKLYLLT